LRKNKEEGRKRKREKCSKKKKKKRQKNEKRKRKKKRRESSVKLFGACEKGKRKKFVFLRKKRGRSRAIAPMF